MGGGGERGMWVKGVKGWIWNSLEWGGIHPKNGTPPPPPFSEKKKLKGWGRGLGEGVPLGSSRMGGFTPKLDPPLPPTPTPLSPSPQTMWKPLKMEPRWESDPKNGEGASEIWDPPP